VCELANLGLVGERLDVDDDVRFRDCALHGLLDGVGHRMRLADG
jgi:hypothetical protein